MLDVNAFFNVSTACRALLSILNSTPFFVRVVSGEVIVEKPQIKRRQKLVNPKRLYTSFIFLSLGHSRIVCTFFGSIRVPSVVTISPKYSTLLTSNLHLVMSTQRLAQRSFSRTSFIQCLQSSSFSLQIRMSSKQVVQKTLRYSRRVLLIKFQKEAGLLQSLNGITRYSKSLYRVRNAIFYLSPSLIRRRLKVEIMSSFIQRFAFDRRARVSIIRGRGYQFLIVIAFNPRQLTQKRRPPPSFLIKSIGEAVGERLARMKPLSSYNLSSLSSSSLSLRDIEYKGL